MRRFYLYYREAPIAYQLGTQLKKSESAHQLGTQTPFPQVLGQVPWRHHTEIMIKSRSVDEALFYIHQTIENGWSRAVLLNYIGSDLYGTTGNAPNNFALTLPDPQSDLAKEMVKDPYSFDFLTLAKGYREKELEDALTANITKFLLTLGQGFAYVGRQVPLEVDGDEYAMDMLFYHLKLRCYVAIELKVGRFSPKDLGQLGFYISTVNHKFKTDADNPTVGLLICKEKKNTVAKYALESSAHPIGISEYELAEVIPENYKSSLPSIEDIEDEFGNMEIPDKSE